MRAAVNSASGASLADGYLSASSLYAATASSCFLAFSSTAPALFSALGARPLPGYSCGTRR